MCIEIMYSQYNSSIYQALRADAEGSAVDHERVETFARKIILKTINFNQFFDLAVEQPQLFRKLSKNNNKNN